MNATMTTWGPPETKPAESVKPTLGMRRAPRHLLLGLALMAAFSVLFALLALRADPSTAVLVVARPVPAGAPITDADLTVVRLVPDPALEVFSEAERDSVVGHTAAVPLAVGSLLSPAQLGAPDWPPVGQSVIAVAVAGGQVPAGLVAGSRVTVLARADADRPEEGDGAVRASASVVEVAAADVSGSVVVSLSLASAEAHRVAALGSGVSLVLESPRR